MKKNLIFLIFGIIILIVGCDINSGRVDLEKNEEINTIDSIELKIARIKAETHLIKYRGVYKEWEGATIWDYYLWYNPVIEDKPAYVEFKIVKDGKDAGYIMVSVTEKDVVVPEYHTEGKTMYEYLKERAKNNNFKAIRFNSFDYAGEIVSRGEKKVVFFGNLDYLNWVSDKRSVRDYYRDYITGYMAKREKLGAIGGNKEEMEEFYKNYYDSEKKREEREVEISVAGGVKRDKASSKYPDKKYANVWGNDRIPAYRQFLIPNKGISGCTPTAAAMLFVYWYNYHGRTKLFKSPPSRTWLYDGDIPERFPQRNYIPDFPFANGEERRVIEQLGSHMKTSYSREGSGTIDLNARNGLWDYLYYDAGYRGFYVNLYYGVDTDGTGLPYEFCRATWDVIFKEINENRPVILNYHDHEVDSDKKRNGHSAVAYSCIIEQDPDSGRYQNINLTIRTGWLRPPKVYWLADVPTTKSVSAVNFSFFKIVT